MDRRTVIALLLCLVVFAGFTALQSRYLPKPQPKPNATAVDTSLGAAPAPTSAVPPVPGAIKAATPLAVPPVPARDVVIETPLYRATFTNIGARLKNVELKRYAAAWGHSQYAENPSHRPKRGELVPEGDRVALDGEPLFALDMGAGPAMRSLAATPFAVAESTTASGDIAAVTFTARDSAGMEVRQTWRVDPATYKLDLEVATANAPADARDWSLTLRSWPLLNDAHMDQESRSVRSIGLLGKNLHRDGAQGLIGKPERLREGAVHWAGVQTHYFLALAAPVGGEGRAVVSRGRTHIVEPQEMSRLPKGAKPQQPVAEGTLVMPVPATGTQHFAMYFGPADYFSLAKLSGAGSVGSLQLERAVDLGANWLLPLSYPLLQLLRFLYSLVHNYGLAILLIATLVRLVLHPLNMASMKSMRAMQKLQPEMERIREKYKNKPEAMNAAVMALYKENKVNPAGGCLPMVLQMPLFFALYAVLFNAIDLRQAPFVAWIHDLSAPDHLFSIAGFPIRLLPIVMAGTGFLQQRFTPTPPQQASTMYLMNFFMLFIFYGLPSGLVFYWTVMNLYTVLQQWLAMRGDDGVVVPVGAGSARGKA